MKNDRFYSPLSLIRGEKLYKTKQNIEKDARNWKQLKAISSNGKQYTFSNPLKLNVFDHFLAVFIPFNAVKNCIKQNNI